MSFEWPYPAPADDGAARHLVAGLALPDIALPATTGPAVSLARITGRAIVFVYTWTGKPGLANPPGWDDIPGAHGSTPEAEGFRNLHSAFLAADTNVIGVSVQSTAWQQEFAQRLGLPYALLSDERLELQRALRLPTFTTGGTTYLQRLTMVVANGRLVRAVYPVHPPHAHAREMLASLSASLGYRLESRALPVR